MAERVHGCRDDQQWRQPIRPHSPWRPAHLSGAVETRKRVQIHQVLASLDPRAMPPLRRDAADAEIVVRRLVLEIDPDAFGPALELALCMDDADHAKGPAPAE